MSEQAADGDLIDRIVEYLATDFPDLTQEKLAQIGEALRDEFRGEGVYIPKRSPSRRQKLVNEILATFNGRNAAEVARRLQIGRTTVYRTIKQHGSRAKSSHFSGK